MVSVPLRAAGGVFIIYIFCCADLIDFFLMGTRIASASLHFVDEIALPFSICFYFVFMFLLIFIEKLFCVWLKVFGLLFYLSFMAPPNNILPYICL